MTRERLASLANKILIAVHLLQRDNYALNYIHYSTDLKGLFNYIRHDVDGYTSNNNRTMHLVCKTRRKQEAAIFFF